MISLRDAKITDSLPKIIAKEPWAQAMAYAVSRQMGQLMNYANGVLLFANTDNMPDAILDILAVELRLPYYDQSYTTQVKRELIKGAFTYWASTGTVASLAEILVKIFGDAEIEEWFEYGGDPGYFRILTGNPNITGNTLEQFKQTAQNVKRLSAWLEEVLVDMAIPNMNIFNGFALYDHTETTLTQEG
jgi:phage tail P2-like protein